MSSNLTDTVKDLFQEKRYNCSQAIFAAYGEQLGLGKIDHETCVKITSGFGGGIAKSGNVCGALTGAIMAIGLKYGGHGRKEQEKSNKIARKLLDEFKSIHGSIICRELINHDLITDEDVQQAFKNGSFKNCQNYVEDVSLILEKLL